MIECILDGMEASSHKVVNLLKLDKVTQGSDENPAMFLNWLTEALVQYTRLSPESPIGAATWPIILSPNPHLTSEKSWPRPRTALRPLFETW